jgi:hypothetical protein
MKISELQRYLDAKLFAEGDIRVVCNDGEDILDINDCYEFEGELVLELIDYKWGK